MSSQKQLDAARQSVSDAMVRIEDRLPHAANEDEKNLLRTGYARLFDIYDEIVRDRLVMAATKVAKATTNLRKVIDSAASDPLATYLKKLRKSVIEIGGNPLPSVENGGGAGGNGGSPESGSDGSTPHSEMTDLWQNLVSAYEAYDKSPDQLKIASLSQWIIESDRGTSELATDHNNFGGLKYRERMKDHATYVDYQGSDGELTGYCKFASVQDFLEGYWHFVSSGPYDGWEEYSDNAAGYIRHIAQLYAADQEYTTKVLGVFEEAEQLLGLSETLPQVDNNSGDGKWRLAVVVGHNSNAQGASAGSPISTSEFVFNSRVANEIVNQASHYNIEAKVFHREKHPQGYGKEIGVVYGKVKAWPENLPNAIIELHFNSSSNPQAHGTEMLYMSGNAMSLALAGSVVKTVQELLGLKLRHSDGKVGISSGMRGWASVSAISSIPSILTEPFFGSNQEDRLRVASLGEHRLALAYLRGVRNFLSEDG